MAHPNQLIDARAALWTVIEGLDYAAIGSSLQRKVKFAEKDQSHREMEPSHADLPMVAMIPLGASKKVETTQRTGIPYRLLVRTWSDSWVPDFPDKFIPELIKKLKASAAVKIFKPTLSATYVQTRLNGPGDRGPRVTRCDIVIELNVCL